MKDVTVWNAEGTEQWQQFRKTYRIQLQCKHALADLRRRLRRLLKEELQLPSLPWQTSRIRLAGRKGKIAIMPQLIQQDVQIYPQHQHESHRHSISLSRQLRHTEECHHVVDMQGTWQACISTKQRI